MESKGYFGYGVLHRSSEFLEWESSKGYEYLSYRNQWGLRVVDRDPGKIPLSLNLELTTRCNLACSFCSNPTLEKSQVRDLGSYYINSVLDSVSKFKIPAANMNGLGESLLRKDFCSIALRLKEANILDLMVHTNCTVMSEDLADQLIDSGMDRIIFSVDSPIKKTYEKMRLRRTRQSIEVSKFSTGEYFDMKTDIDLTSALWEETIANVLLFRSRRNLKNKITPLIRATMILLDDTQGEVETFLAFWKGIADQITLQDLSWKDKLLSNGQVWQNKQKHSEIDLVSDLVDNYINSSVTFSCPCIYQAAWIMSNGDVTPCSNPNARKNDGYG